MTACFRLLLLVLAMVSTASCRSKSPLLDDEPGRTRNKAAECVFGKQIRELNSQWIPDLGIPIGVLYCMRCECVPIQRKRRRVARVQCRNIKSECPEPTCDEPILLPGRCCKSCPGDNNNPDVIQDVIPQNVIEEEEKNVKHYAALLTGRSSLDLRNDSLSHDLNKNNVVATGRFTIHKRNLHYSFYISEKAARPRALHFMDKTGNILEEFTLSHSGGLVNSLYQNATRKVCGVWKRVPREYRQILKHESLYVVLVWGSKDSEFTLSGRLARHVALASEQFSSLLEPAPGSDPKVMAGAGGTAIVSTFSTLSPSIHIAIIFNGLFASNEIFEVPLEVTLMLEEKKQFTVQEVVKVAKPATDLNIVELSSPVTQAELRLLTRGRLLISLSSVSKPEAMRLSGNVITKVHCELFQTTLASSQSDKVNPFGTSGLAWMYLNNQGSLIYSVQIENLAPNQQHPVITLVDTSNKRKTELEDLTLYFYDGWANGTLDKLSPKILDPLYSGKLDVIVTFGNYTTIHGRLSPKPIADARDAPSPILLKRENHTLPTYVVGMVWLSVDSDCHLHYDLSIAGIGQEMEMGLYVELYPSLAPGAPFIDKHLEDFKGSQVEGSPVDSLSKEELDMLESGYNFMKVKDVKTKVVLLSTAAIRVKVPISCRPPYADNNVPNIPQLLPVTIASEDCFFEEKFYKNDASWVSASNPCQMCFCQGGKAKCDIMTCPELDCPNANKTEVIGECCPVCGSKDLTNASMQKCIFNGQTYSPGSKFYPFLIPGGFDLCTECHCDPTYLEIKCLRLNDNEKNCSRVKAPPNENIIEDDHLIAYPTVPAKPTLPPISPEQVLKGGGCKNPNDPYRPYQNETVFHPPIASLGEYKCVTCKCTSGNISCKSQQCSWKSCKQLFELQKEKRKNKKLTINYADYCCSLKECRRLRHKKRADKVNCS